MKSVISFLRLGLLLSLLLWWGCEKDDNAPSLPSRLESKQFNSLALANNPAGNPTLRDMVVYTPPGYDPKGKETYSVVYLLHGLPMTDSAFINREKWDRWINPNGILKTYPDFPQEGFRLWVDNLIEAGKMEPMIIVMPDASAAPYLFSFYSNSVLNGNYEDYIVNDLVNYVDANYKTIRNKSGRALIGFSQGGYGAFKLGMKHSEKFGVVAAHSAPLVLQALIGVSRTVIAENPDGMNGPHPDKLLTSIVYGMSGSWSPNLNNPPFFVDLPFEYPSGNAIPGVMARWLENDPLTMLQTYGSNFKTMQGIYFDIGNRDEFGFVPMYDYLKQALDAYGIPYTFEIYDGGHFDRMFARLAVSLDFCSRKMKQ